ncbi:hypothetical protein M885DRAFT_626577 [Pelagophyceae sp. CCMP2097]|nr:hypothetical protein M885DRAFT_626577 [Pelagophyceae sp. CCMP2097]|mmetsp:Transcript_25801/g.86706  ORF Transcript_25801/g.86706 Transcript_25801/m.86706 type:complete len:1246 (-) Transcript_25801:146-3883(-)
MNTPLFEEVCSKNFLDFSFGGRSYGDQLVDAVRKTKQHCAVRVDLRQVRKGGESVDVVWVQHDFAFLGGSLGCAEGEKVARAFEHGTQHGLPVIVACRTGGARMQEGTLSLMQMAKVSVAVDAHRRAKLPFISLLEDPTYGGVSASYAMQGDVKIAAPQARIGFAGPGVILNTMFEMNQEKFDAACPAEFQSAEYCLKNGAVDLVLADGSPECLQGTIYDVVSALLAKPVEVPREVAPAATAAEKAQLPDYTAARGMRRPQYADVRAALFSDFVELSGDGRAGKDSCIQGGVAKFRGVVSCVVIGCLKGHTPGAMQDANYGMPSPAGYRTALRLFQLAERFGLPVVTFVDTCGAWPSFPAEDAGQSEAIATNLTAMAGLRTAIVTVVLGEGGSGGALGLAMGNAVGMLSQAYYGVISPEGAASILGRYKDDAHKAAQFPKDCHELATAQSIYAYQLQKLGVVDEVIYEDANETCDAFAVTAARIAEYVSTQLATFAAMAPDELVSQRYGKYRALGQFLELSVSERNAAVLAAEAASTNREARPPKVDVKPCKLVRHLAHQVLHGERARFMGHAFAGAPISTPAVPADLLRAPVQVENAKSVLDARGPEAMCAWVRAQPQVLITDTTMRDAHQSLLATRARTIDLVKGARLAANLLPTAFSFECWGGATFDVAYRFLNEDPWDRLRAIRAAAPNVCTQMLIRGANAVGYTSYPDNVVEDFVRLSAANGMDVFRIFDCFNDVENMKVCIDAVRACNKVAEVCVCYTSDMVHSKIYDCDYYQSVAKKCAEAGAHMIGIKDMAGLLKPAACAPLVAAIRAVCDLPIHFHTHCTSSASLAVAMEMTRCGCDIVDFAIASMADLTSQPSLNAFCAAMDGMPRSPGIDYMALEPLDIYWMKVREMYKPFETGMLAGSARVFDHEIPGGQYANLFVQCGSMGLGGRWAEVLDMYRDVNRLFGDIVKVTPSSKCVGDLALFLINKNMRCGDVLKGGAVDYPDSVLELMEGRLGFPHRGFPIEVVKSILGVKPQLTQRPSAALPPADAEQTGADLSAKWGKHFDDERISSALLYPKVFDDFMKFCETKTAISVYLPTPVFFYAFEVGQTAIIEGLPAPLAEIECGVRCEAPTVDVTITLKRVGPVKAGRMRTVVFDVDGREEHVEVAQPTADGEFAGLMADSSNEAHVASPMPGAVEKVLFKEGESVLAGDELVVITAMKMQVKVKAPFAGKVAKLLVKEGDKVVEAALLAVLSK